MSKPLRAVRIDAKSLPMLSQATNTSADEFENLIESFVSGLSS